MSQGIPYTVADEEQIRRELEESERSKTAVITEDRKCGECGAHVESVSGEPVDPVPTGNGHMVHLSVWYTLMPCGHVFRRATGANLD